MPIEALCDHRLTLIQVRVLGAICSFGGKSRPEVWAKRRRIAERCGYGASTVTRATSQLVKLGWLSKVGNGGRSSPSRYRITVPDLVTVSGAQTVADSDTLSGSETVPGSDTLSDAQTVPGPDTVSKTVADPDTVSPFDAESEAKTVSDPETVPDPGTVSETVSDPDTKTVSDPDTRKEPTKEPKSKKHSFRGAKGKFFDFADDHGAIAEAHDYDAVLGKKKAATSERAWNGRLKTLQSLAEKGQSVKDVISRSADSGWTGLFEVRHANANGTRPGAARESFADRNDRLCRAALEATFSP